MERAAEADRRRASAFVDSTSASFPFLTGLAAPGRVVITATNSAGQKYHTVFADAFIQALTATDGRPDKNGRISLLEAFVYASRLVTQHYEQRGVLPTEHAVFDDTGDGKARTTPRRSAAPGHRRRPDVSRCRRPCRRPRSGSAAAAAAPAGADRSGRRPAPAAAVDDAGGVRSGIREADHRALAGLARRPKAPADRGEQL